MGVRGRGELRIAAASAQRGWLMARSIAWTPPTETLSSAPWMSLAAMKRHLPPYQACSPRSGDRSRAVA